MSQLFYLIIINFNGFVYKLETSGTIKIARALHNTSSLITLDISNNNIGSEAADDVAAILSHNSKLQQLYLGGNKLETSGTIKIARALHSTSSLLHSTSSLLHSTSSLLHSTSSLLTLDISNNSTGSEATSDITDVLSHNTKLQKFDINKNNLETAGTIKIAKVLQDISTLMELSISNNNNIGRDDIATVLRHNIKLKQFYIWKNDFGLAGVVKALQNILTLTETDISSNIIDNETAGYISVVLSLNTKLQKFDMVGYNMETDSAIKIAVALQSNNTSLLLQATILVVKQQMRLQIFWPTAQNYKSSK